MTALSEKETSTALVYKDIDSVTCSRSQHTADMSGLKKAVQPAQRRELSEDLLSGRQFSYRS